MRTSHIFCALPVALLLAQTDRTIGPLEISRTVRLPGHLHPLAQPRFEQGRVAAESPIGPVILSLAKTPAQQAELEKLLQAQQDQSSPNYRHWLTPEQHSNILVSDIGAFRSMFGLPASDPQVVVYGPDPGLSSGQGEATGDIEAAMGVARNATIVLVVSTSALHSVAHEVDDALAPVIGLSSGSCESLVSASQPLPCRAIAQQANAEGITWVTGSSDSGATACEAKGATPLAGHGLAIGFSSRYSRGYRDRRHVVHRQRRPLLERDQLSHGRVGTILRPRSGGASAIYPRPAWQTGPGVPQDGARDVPDISLISSCARTPFVVMAHCRHPWRQVPLRRHPPRYRNFPPPLKQSA